MVVFASPNDAVGAPVIMWFLKCTLENINIGGTWLPMTLTAVIIVRAIPAPCLWKPSGSASKCNTIPAYNLIY